MDFKVSTPQAKDVGPYFRIRMNPPFFDVVYEMTTFSVANGNAAPDEDGQPTRCTGACRTRRS